MSGIKNSLTTRFNDWIGSNRLIKVNGANHKLQLCLNKSYQNYKAVEEIETFSHNIGKYFMVIVTNDMLNY